MNTNTPGSHAPVGVTHVLYLHGFRSSPLSVKAQSTGQEIARIAPRTVWWCPQLPASPSEAIAMLLDGVANWPHEQMAVVGSSLGGFYATYLAERLGCTAVVLNPAVHAARDLTRAIGEHSQWHSPSEYFEFKAGYVDELRELEMASITRPERYFTVITKGDEVLDWREMHAHYPKCAGLLLEGGDHAISDYNEHLPRILQFLNLAQ